MPDLEGLQKHPALEHLNSTQLGNLAAVGRFEDRPADHELIGQGEKGDRLFFLLEGTLEVVFSDQPTDKTRIEVTAPAIVGEMEFLTDEPRTATVRCTGPCSLLSVPYGELRERVRDGDPAVLKFIAHIATVLALRLTRMTQKFAEIDASAPPARREELMEFRKTLFTDWTV